MEAEIEALRIAAVNLRRLGYQGVTFCGDLQSLYRLLQNYRVRMKSQDWRHLSVATHLHDIMKISDTCGFSFKQISGLAKSHADHLAKQATCNSQNYVIKWTI